MLMDKISHYDLCRATAERYFKALRADVALWEYKTMMISEEPDVLIYKASVTTLYEIKVSRSDFLADKKKECRVKYKSLVHTWIRSSEIPGVKKLESKHYPSTRFMVEAPHIGEKRYYVCPAGMIDAKEVPQNWGLIWYKNGRFSVKKSSEKHRHNIHWEMSLLSHAFRKKTGPDECNVIVNSFESRG